MLCLVKAPSGSQAPAWEISDAPHQVWYSHVTPGNKKNKKTAGKTNAARRNRMSNLLVSFEFTIFSVNVINNIITLTAVTEGLR
jgi:hypothetical protein